MLVNYDKYCSKEEVLEKLESLKGDDNFFVLRDLCLCDGFIYKDEPLLDYFVCYDVTDQKFKVAKGNFDIIPTDFGFIIEQECYIEDLKLPTKKELLCKIEKVKQEIYKFMSLKGPISIDVFIVESFDSDSMSFKEYKIYESSEDFQEATLTEKIFEKNTLYQSNKLWFKETSFKENDNPTTPVSIYTKYHLYENLESFNTHILKLKEKLKDLEKQLEIGMFLK